jgi:nuclear pore complex protein Nup205
VQLSLEIIILVLEKDLLLSDYWRPLYQVSVLVSRTTSQHIIFKLYI